VRIAYIAHSRFPTEKANGAQIAQVCSALAALGHDVTLVTPTVRTGISGDPFAYYGVPPSFRIVRLPTFDALASPFVPEAAAFALGMFSYTRGLRSFLSSASFDLLYARSPVVLPALLRTPVPVVLELHAFPRWGVRRFVRRCNRCRTVVCLTSLQRDALIHRGVEVQRIVVEPDGVDLRRYAALPSPPAAKERWQLPSDRPVLGYVGSLVTRDILEKGVGEFLGALVDLHRRGREAFGWIVGGPDAWRRRYEAQARALGIPSHSVRFQGAIPFPDVPSAIAACDVCVYPAPASSHPYFQRDTSPLKLFEYLAAGRPIVSADLPPVRDIVDEETAAFCRPGDPVSLADTIGAVLDHPEEAAARAVRGKERVKKYAWEERMRRILSVSA
jgi:glycosyltransferase involved in cell wall biosynthesis